MGIVLSVLDVWEQMVDDRKAIPVWSQSSTTRKIVQR